MWKNKHVVVAMLVAPILAVLAWFAVDQLVSEQARPAEPGATYTLVAKSNCRYASGRCDLENADFKLSLAATGSEGAMTLELESAVPLTGAVAAIGSTSEALAQVQPLAATDGSRKAWQLGLGNQPAQGDTLRIAAVADGSTWFAEVPAVFIAAAD
jgi:hypothetical protein